MSGGRPAPKLRKGATASGDRQSCFRGRAANKKEQLFWPEATDLGKTNQEALPSASKAQILGFYLLLLAWRLKKNKHSARDSRISFSPQVLRQALKLASAKTSFPSVTTGSHRNPARLLHFYLAPQEGNILSVAPHKQFISSWPSPKKEQSNISSLGGHFYIAPYEHFISGWKGAKDQNWPCEAPEATFWRRPFVDVPFV